MGAWKLYKPPKKERVNSVLGDSLKIGSTLTKDSGPQNGGVISPVFEPDDSPSYTPYGSHHQPACETQVSNM